MSFIADMTLNQSEISLLCDALDEWCAQRRIELSSADGRDAATVMLGLYKTGHDSKARIIKAMNNVNGL